MSRLYSNENFPFPTVEELRKLGHDVLTTLESGRAGLRIPDDEVLKFATQTERVLLTMNRKHFINLHKAKPDHFGIIVCTFDPNFVALAQRIDAALKASDNTHGKLIRVNRPNR
ncbi:MAG: DUF5615 family PIN-like protein [Chloroflexi bacterium]|nr:DUF5615 family PIN-like protein [Chloroflexota bacterium]